MSCLFRLLEIVFVFFLGGSSYRLDQQAACSVSLFARSGFCRACLVSRCCAARLSFENRRAVCRRFLLYVARTMGTIGSTPTGCCEERRRMAKVASCGGSVHSAVTSLHEQMLYTTSCFLPSIHVVLLMFLSLAPAKRRSAHKMPNDMFAQRERYLSILLLGF